MHFTILQSTIMLDLQNEVTVMTLFFVQHCLTSIYIQGYLFHYIFRKTLDSTIKFKTRKIAVSAARVVALCNSTTRLISTHLMFN